MAILEIEQYFTFIERLGDFNDRLQKIRRNARPIEKLCERRYSDKFHYFGDENIQPGNP